MKITATIVVIGVTLAWQVSCAEATFYRAAVGEFYPLPGHNESDAQHVLSVNLQRIASLVGGAQEQAVDILVLPEDALYNFLYFATRDDLYPFLVRLPALGTPLCATGASRREAGVDVLKELGCMARAASLVIVVDVGEREDCSASALDCPADGRYQYNTQIVVDETGALLSRYRKYHLFPEDYTVFDRPALELVSFRTSFGVRFGQAICFDLFFRAPILALAQDGVRDFVFSTYWENDGTIPPITATALQQGVSRAAAANLLGANIGYGKYSSGSGIYARGEPLAAFFCPIPSWHDTRLLVSEVPVAAPPAEPRARLVAPPIVWGGDVSSFPAEWRLATALLRAGPGTMGVAHGAIRCAASWDVDHAASSPETFVLVATDSTFFDGLLPTQMCALYRCAGAVDDAPPGFGNCSRFTVHSETLFRHIELNVTGLADGAVSVPAVYGEDAALFSYATKELETQAGPRSFHLSVTPATPRPVVSTVVHSQPPLH